MSNLKKNEHFCVLTNSLTNLHRQFTATNLLTTVRCASITIAYFNRVLIKRVDPNTIHLRIVSTYWDPNQTWKINGSGMAMWHIWVGYTIIEMYIHIYNKNQDFYLLQNSHESMFFASYPDPIYIYIYLLQTWKKIKIQIYSKFVMNSKTQQ